MAATRLRIGIVQVFAALIAAGLWPLHARAEIALVDAAGRAVSLEAPAERIVTNDSLLLLSLGLIDPYPVARLAGWATPGRVDAGIYAAFRERFPAIDEIPTVGSVVPGNASVEAILSARPDLFAVSIWESGWAAIADRLNAAGVPVIFLEGPETAEEGPAESTAYSIELLGRAIGRQAEAEAFATLVREHYSAVANRLEGIEDRPDVLIDVHAGTLCCFTPGSGNRITNYLELAGGHNIGADYATGYDGQLTIEYVMSVDPEFYVGTGSPHLAERDGLVMGGGIDAETARASLRDVVGRNLLGELTAVREKKAVAISHQLAITPLNVLVVECLAKWLHPSLFAELDPAATVAEINERFMAVPLEGTFCIGLDKELGPAVP